MKPEVSHLTKRLPAAFFSFSLKTEQQPRHVEASLLPPPKHRPSLPPCPLPPLSPPKLMPSLISADFQLDQLASFLGLKDGSWKSKVGKLGKVLVHKQTSETPEGHKFEGNMDNDAVVDLLVSLSIYSGGFEGSRVAERREGERRREGRTGRWSSHLDARSFPSF